MADLKFSLKVGAASIAALSLGYFLLRPSRINKRPEELHNEYDFIVVGAGSSGAVVAHRLGLENHKVLVLEAGGLGDDAFLAKAPIGSGELQKTDVDWKFATEPQEHSHDMYEEKRSRWPRGKVIGGSSILNYMAYVRGNPADYDSWQEAGCEGWSYKDVLPYFKKSENIQIPSLKESPFHGKDGPLHVNETCFPRSSVGAWLKACEEAGIPFNPDYNSDQQFGVSKQQSSTQRGERCSTAKAFLRPILKKKSNVHLVVYAHVTRVLFNEKKEAVGVAYRINENGRIGPELFVGAKKEVIVCAGAVQSPQILMLSGIGPQHRLEEHGIRVIVNNENVGENLRDHLACSLGSTSPKLEVFPIKSSLIYLLRFLFSRSGPLTSTCLEATAFLQTGLRTDLNRQPDLQIHLVPFLGGADGMERFGIKKEYISKTGVPLHGVSALPIILHPKSVGYIHLRSADPFDAPVIQPNYLSHPDDVKVLVNGLKICKKIFETKTWKGLSGGEINYSLTHKLLGTKYEPYSEEWYEAFVRHSAMTLYHPVGTCAMGPSESKTAVVDPQLRVLGVSRLRVADASIMPTLVSGNTNAPAIMIGEKAADMINKAWQ